MIDVRHGDSREVLKTLADASIDSCVTDPPYALVSIGKRFGADDAAPVNNAGTKVGNKGDLYARAAAGFMGKKWDTGETAFDAAFWREVWRVLKPGAHVLAFGGTRSFHRLACAIEDAGFEIRDTIFYCYGSGFPKSHNIGKKLDAAQERCACDKDMRGMRNYLDSDDPVSSDAEQDLRPRLPGEVAGVEDGRPSQKGSGDVRHMRPSSKCAAAEQDAETNRQRDLLQSSMLGAKSGRPSKTDRAVRRGGDYTGNAAESSDARAEEPGMEGRRDLPQAPGKLCVGEIRPLPAGISNNGTAGRVRDGASSGDGAVGAPPAHQDGDGASSGSRAAEQHAEQSGTVAGQPESQAGGAWPLCRGCGKPIIPDGLGTALKPAVEPICVARKPLIGTVATNIQKYGTGAINIDGCRVPIDPEADASQLRTMQRGQRTEDTSGQAWGLSKIAGDTPQVVRPDGRWPANVIHDGSEEVLAAFPQAPGQQRSVGPANGAKPSINTYGDFGPRSEFAPRGDSGSAARFFYTAKADKIDRLGSKHPTVKPVDLMAYLCRLVTPPGGTVLDPFAGSGSTGMACLREGFNAILIEREAEYHADILRRIAHVSGQDAPLFAVAE